MVIINTKMIAMKTTMIIISDDDEDDDNENTAIMRFMNATLRAFFSIFSP